MGMGARMRPPGSSSGMVGGQKGMSAKSEEAHRQKVFSRLEESGKGDKTLVVSWGWPWAAVTRRPPGVVFWPQHQLSPLLRSS